MNETAAAAPGVPKTSLRHDVPHQRGVYQDTPQVQHALHYAQARRWDVFAGAWLETVRGVPRCCCGETGCAQPGAHPVDHSWQGEATAGVTAVRRLWASRPGASVLLPTGRSFDVIDVPEVAGCLALARMERMELPLGPVACSPDGRMLFFVLPGAAVKVPALLRTLGWSPGALDLTTHGEGGWVAAPPTRLGGRGCVQWVRGPSPANRWVPDAEELLAPLAYACGREAAVARTATR